MYRIVLVILSQLTPLLLRCHNEPEVFQVLKTAHAMLSMNSDKQAEEVFWQKTLASVQEDGFSSVDEEYICRLTRTNNLN